MKRPFIEATFNGTTGQASPGRRRPRRPGFLSPLFPYL